MSTGPSGSNDVGHGVLVIVRAADPRARGWLDVGADTQLMKSYRRIA